MFTYTDIWAEINGTAPVRPLDLPDEQWRRAMVRLGRYLHGERYQSALAADIAEKAGQECHQSQVSVWATGARPLPQWARIALRQLIVLAAVELQNRATGLGELVVQLDEVDKTRPRPGMGKP